MRSRTRAAASSRALTRSEAPRRAKKPARAASQPRNLELSREIGRLEATLGKAAAEWRFTIDAIPDLILVCDPNRAIYRLNRSALAVLGGTYSDWVGQPTARLESCEPVATILQCARRLLAEAPGQTQRIRESETGTVWDVSCAKWDSSPQGDTDTDTDTAVVVARNVSETVQLEESLARAEGMAEMGRLLGAVAHEVRNPLFGISALLEAWSVNLSSADPQTYIALLTPEVDRLRTLMADLLEYGRPFTVNLRVASLQGTVLEAIRTCERQAAGKGVTLTSTLSESLVKMDTSRLPRVFTNLLENAIQHSPAGSVVSISVQPEGPHDTAVHVTDSGPGFSDEVLEHLFTPFYSRRRGGTGLGLAIAKRIVDEHDGSVAVRNVPGGGATVTVTLPRAD